MTFPLLTSSPLRSVSFRAIAYSSTVSQSPVEHRRLSCTSSTVQVSMAFSSTVSKSSVEHRRLSYTSSTGQVAMAYSSTVSQSSVEHRRLSYTSSTVQEVAVAYSSTVSQSSVEHRRLSCTSSLTAARYRAETSSIGHPVSRTENKQTQGLPTCKTKTRASSATFLSCKGFFA